MQRTEDYTRQLEAAKTFILEHDQFLVVSHLSPDGDAIGSTSAMGRMLKQLGKQFVLCNEDPVPRKFETLWGADAIRQAGVEAPESRFSTVITVDCADYSRTGRSAEWIAEGADLLNIDHHPTNDGFGTCTLLKPQAASTTEILYDLAVSLGVAWTEPLATSIYTGLLTDTGGFRYSSTTPAVMRIAAEMLEHGAQGSVLAERMLETVTRSHIGLLGKAIDSLSFSSDGRIAWMGVHLQDLEEAGASDEDLDGIVNYPRNIAGVVIGIFVKEKEPGVFKASLRSSGADVSAIAQRFGGGGHIRAAGCTLRGSYEDVVAQLVTEAGKAIS
ncbi:phosphoesterase RecJ-like protein [Paenibacillus sp. J31TS4]|uniref:DHH family phosphoesterase n=1 Tax=Paenibacillus sp. J31TS4 TaxID=2807195 RepID=UPI001B1AE0A6|nr:bifunctional oligoribonuclease/PAP phosphatase NrnA [Paenibacillus sp. J31TS4]GIP36859.1 phosphoesterase RecJ-like protein [Paenibacillus sp. J31TS4]